MSLLGTLVSPLIFFVICLIVAIAFRVYRRFRPTVKLRREQTLITEYMGDTYPYLRQRLEGSEDSDYSEAEGYESSALMDEEDIEDN
jgi:hypothetical protein